MLSLVVLSFLVLETDAEGRCDDADCRLLNDAGCEGGGEGTGAGNIGSMSTWVMMDGWWLIDWMINQRPSAKQSKQEASKDRFPFNQAGL